MDRNTVGMEEAGRCPPADACDVSSKGEIDEAFLLEVYGTGNVAKAPQSALPVEEAGPAGLGSLDLC